MKARIVTDMNVSTAVTAEYDDARMTDCSKRGIPKGVKGRDGSKKIEVADFTTFNSFFFDKKRGNMRMEIFDYLNCALSYGEFDRLTGQEIITEHLTMQDYNLYKMMVYNKT